MSTNNGANSFLASFSNKELKLVLSDIEAYRNDIKFFYIVDTYDIINFTLPFTNFEHIDSLNDNQTLQTAIAYDLIFSKKDRFNFSLANEYSEELKSYVNRLNSKLRRFPQIKDNLIKEILENEMSEDAVFERFMSENLELFTVVYIFIKYGGNVYDRLNQFIKSDLNTSKFISGNKTIDLAVNTAFKESQVSDYAVELFQKFASKEKYRLLSFDSDYERYCYLDNTFRDIAVIDRIENTNKKLVDLNVSFRYVSSAPIKTGVIFDLISKDDPKKVNFGRNIQQLYLFNFLIDNTNTIEEGRKIINGLLKIEKIQSGIDKTLEREKYDILTTFISSLENTFSKHKENLEKSFFYKSFLDSKNEVENIFKNIANQNKSITETRFLNLFNNFDFNLLKEIEVEKNISTIPDIARTFDLRRKIEASTILNRDAISINSGKDIIRNTFIHLPYLLFYKLPDKNELVNSFQELLNKISGKPQFVGVKSKLSAKEFQNVIKHFSEEKMIIESQSVEFIILLYLIMITENKYNEESKIIQSFEHYKTILENFDISTEIARGTNSLKLFVRTKNQHLITEINYILLWLYRRTCRFKKAVLIGQSLIQKSNDPRFYLGIGLVYHSWGYNKLENEKEKEDVISDFNYAQEFLKQSLLMFEESIIDTDSIELVSKQKVGILNTIIDGNLRKLEILQIYQTIDQNLLSDSRNYMTKLKNIIKSDLKNLNYPKLDTINHTEAELEYFEATELFELGKYQRALKKLKHSNSRADDFINDKNLVIERFRTLSIKNALLEIKIKELLN